MSMNRTTYLIAGYDLTNYKTDKYEEWSWTDEYENYTCNQVKGKIQLFDDPLNGVYLYLGYILAEIDDYGDYDAEIINPKYISEVMPDVNQALIELEAKGVISGLINLRLDYKLIIFDEWS